MKNTMNNRKLITYIMAMSICSALIFHLSFNCFNPLGFVSCASIKAFVTDTSVRTIIFLIFLIGCAFFVIKSAIPYFKFKGNNFIDIDLITGTDLTFEDEQLRKEYWKYTFLCLIWGLCWLPIALVL
jgi:hypothetical protein